MEHDLFTAICETLGYAGRDVLSVRVNVREAVVTVFRDGELENVTLRLPGSDASAGSAVASRQPSVPLAER
jgi:hypothetical protein